MQEQLKKKIWMVTAALMAVVATLCITIVTAVSCPDSQYAQQPVSVHLSNDTPPPDSGYVWTNPNYEQPAVHSTPMHVALTEDDELRAVWIPYMSEYYIDAQKIDQMVANCKAVGANAIIFHVRAFGDALYDSLYFPWSHLISGTQGTAPSGDFDPLQYMIDKAHENGMQLHAWVNPLRIQLNGGNLPQNLSSDNPYNIWRGDSDPSNDHYVIDYDGGKFYNPAEEEVRRLIVNGMAEIVANYNVDGVHWDDYFYPATDDSFDDSISYQNYLNSGGTLSLTDWRTQNINTLVKDVYNKVKATDSNCVFGISPAGNIGNCLAAGADVYEWCSQSGYIDYICPQIYWTFDNTVAPFAKRCAEWKAMVTNESIKFYVGLALYKAGTDSDGGKWADSDDNIAQQIEYIRENEINADGFMIFSYQQLNSENTAAEVENIKKVILG